MEPLCPTFLTMKKTLYHTFIPSKIEEEAGIHYQLFQTLMEIRDVDPAPDLAKNPYPISKILSYAEVLTGVVYLSHHEAFEHLFRYWTMENTLSALTWTVSDHHIWDMTDEDCPMRFSDINFCRWFFNESYGLKISGLIRYRNLRPSDEIGLGWCEADSCFVFKLLRRNTGHSLRLPLTIYP